MSTCAMLPADPTLLIEASRGGDAQAFGVLFDAVYEELRRLARRSRRGSANETLNTTALVHEAYLKIADGGATLESRAHVLGVAAKAMRHVLIDHARRQGALKRRAGAEAIPLRETLVGSETPGELVALDEALGRLERLDARAARVVECRFFGGLTIEETAAALGLSAPTVQRSWRAARAWLYRDLQSGL